MRRWTKSLDSVRVVGLSRQPLPVSLQKIAIDSGADSDPSTIEAYMWFKKWGDERIGNNTIKQLLEYRGISLWWFVDLWLVGGWGLPSFDEIYIALHRITNAIRGCHPERIVLLSNDPLDDLVASAVALHLRVSYSWNLTLFQRTWYRFKQYISPRLLYTLRLVKMMLRGCLAHLLGRSKLRKEERIDLLCNTTSTTMNPLDGTERIVQPLLDRASERGLRFAALHMDFRRNLGLDTLFKLPDYVVSWESFLSLSVLLEASREQRTIRRRWGARIPGEICGIPAANLLSDRVSILLRYRIFDVVLALYMARQALMKIQPRCVFVTDEYDMWGRALVVAARRAGIRVVGIQHGIIDQGHVGYLYSKKEIASDGREESPFCPLPHVTAVHGTLSEATLRASGNYPSSAVCVTGSLMLERAQKRVASSRQVRASLGLPASGFVLVFFGAAPSICPADQDHVEALCAAARLFPDITLILKPHPLDSSGQRRYKEIAKSAGVGAHVIVGADSWDLIAASDAVASFNSTIALDAMALERPHIHINLSGRPDLFQFVSEGGSVGVYDGKDLPLAIQNIKEPSESEEIVVKQKRYVSAVFAANLSPSDAVLNLGL